MFVRMITLEMNGCMFKVESPDGSLTARLIKLTQWFVQMNKWINISRPVLASVDIRIDN